MTSGLSIDTDIHIDADHRHVWASLTHFAGYARWNPYIVAVHGQFVPGSDLRLRSVHIPGKAPTDGIVTLVAADSSEMRWEGGHPDHSILKGDHQLHHGLHQTCDVMMF